MRPAAFVRIAALAWLACVLGASAHAQAPTKDRSDPPCLERPIVVAYLHALQDQIMQRWVMPEDSLADQTVVVRFEVAQDGRLRSWKLVSTTNRRIANSVELAFDHAEPIGPVPERAACLVDRAIEMRFENPY